MNPFASNAFASNPFASNVFAGAGGAPEPEEDAEASVGSHAVPFEGPMQLIEVRRQSGSAGLIAIVLAEAYYLSEGL